MVQGFSTLDYLTGPARHNGMRFPHTCSLDQWEQGWLSWTQWYRVSPHLFTCSMGTWLTRPDTMVLGFSTPDYLFNRNKADMAQHSDTRFLHAWLPVQWEYGWQGQTQWCEVSPPLSPLSPRTVCLHQGASPRQLSCQYGNPDGTRPSCLPRLRQHLHQLPSCPLLEVDEESVKTIPWPWDVMQVCGDRGHRVSKDLQGPFISLEGPGKVIE